MESYYSERLAGQRLKLCYDLAPPATQRYLRSEIGVVREAVRATDHVLELGCGYGRVLREVASRSATLVGIDTSLSSLAMARSYLADLESVSLLRMDATRLGFPYAVFDVVFCIQNGVSAFHVDQRQLLSGAVAVTRKGGTVLFSSYADAFWNDRLEWFRIQASHGLVGPIDEAASGDGVIVCEDGFTATTISCEKFATVSEGLGTSRQIRVVAGSSVFCEITV